MSLRRLMAALALFLLAQEVYSQALYRRLFGDPGCRETYYTGMVPPQFQFQGGFMMWIEVFEWRKLAEPPFRQQVLEAAFRENLEFCKAKGQSASIAVVSIGRAGKSALLQAWTSSSDRSWHITLDTLASAIAEEEAAERRRQAQVERDRAEVERKAAEETARRQRLADEQQRLAEAQDAYEKRIKDSRALFDQFNASTHVADWPNTRELLANPLSFRDKTIAVRARFAENGANVSSIFAIEGGLIWVSTVPAAMKSDADLPILIAATLVGVKNVEWKGQNIRVPELQYRDGYACKLIDCEDVLFWMNPKKP